jgi:hypothetical protein
MSTFEREPNQNGGRVGSPDVIEQSGNVDGSSFAINSVALLALLTLPPIKQLLCCLHPFEPDRH